MSDDGWLGTLRWELCRRGLAAELAEQVVAESAGHLRDSGQAAWRVFGSPDSYAAAVVESIDMATRAGRAAARPGTLRLAARGITKRYGRRTVLADVDLEVRAGEIAAVVGANGCGKSTFLRICAGLLAPDSGEVLVDGAIGYCPQDAGTCDFLFPDEHFVLVGVGRSLSRDHARAAGRANAARLDWDASGRTLARHLSGGTRQKLNLVMAGLGDPDVLLLDEPYQGFDHGSYLDFWAQVWRWRDRGSAVVVVTHLLNQLDRVDKVLDLTRAGDGAPL